MKYPLAIISNKLLVITLITKINIVLSKGELETNSNMNRVVQIGAIPYTIASVCFLYRFVMYFPITKVVNISVIPIAKFIAPKLYPISLIANPMP